MSRIAALLTMLAFAAGASSVAVAYTPLGKAFTDRSAVIYAQEDCAEGEKWNEETQECEAENS